MPRGSRLAPSASRFVLRPMLATLADAPLKQKGLVYEPKYDGIRAIVELTPGRRQATARLYSRNGNDKTAQFPAIVAALERAAARLNALVILDGEIVALDERGHPAGFQRLQGRIHVLGSREAERLDRAQPAALILFDFLADGSEDLCRQPLVERRARLERLASDVLHLKPESTIRISEQVAGDGRAMHARALKEHWEGLIVKDAASVYQAGRRSPAWRKLKIVHKQEFVVAGWTEPRQTRSYFGALLLGVYQGDRLVYVGHTGTGFDQKELERVWRLLKTRETRTSPFVERIKTNEPAHWVRPELVAEVRFTEWTADGKLRHPVYLGLRDDKPAADVVREGAKGANGAKGAKGASAKGAKGAKGAHGAEGANGALIEQMRALEDAKRDGVLTLTNGDRLNVTNLSKVFWPSPKLTKGDLLRYYAQVAPFILPAVEDRPLVMKRFPNGVGGKAFYQQRSREERPPKGVRIETIAEGLDPIREPDARRLVGGSLTTLLYMTQIAAISQDPWFSRVQAPLEMDHAAIDLDPTDGTPFSRVLEVARWVRDELASLAVPGFPKTSGASGLHIYVPLPPRTSYESGMLFCQIVATIVASRHPKAATIERAVARRPRGTVYVDFLQNILGKTLATAYSARASDYAGVSTPLTWDEVDVGVDPREFTIRTAPARFAKVGDLWAGLKTSKPANLEAVFRKYGTR